MSGQLAPSWTGLADSVRWYLREISGAARYDRYVQLARSSGRTPLDRAAYERQRVDHREAHPEGRCC